METDLPHGRALTPVIADKAAFIRANTRLRPVPLVPEISIYVADEAVPLWHKTEEEIGQQGLPPPFWAFAWAGGQALARHILDHAELVRGKTVLDLASGSGLVGIAAIKAGAAKVAVADIDDFALAAAALNASHNNVVLELIPTDLLGDPTDRRWDVILAGDIFYERDTASRAFDFLSRNAALGAAVLIGDPGRSYLPHKKLHKIADYTVPVTRELEDAEIKQTAVWALRDPDGHTGTRPDPGTATA
ncbi:MAG: 50S ribosomal protein L11 methyltransferase [Sediminibacterium sp.]